MKPYDQFLRQFQRGYDMSKREFDTFAIHLFKCCPISLNLLTSEKLESKKSELISMVQRLRQGEPIDYILGSKSFYGLNLKVNSDVLIPRHETELLVDEIILRNKTQSPKRIYDICCGSGAIGLALKKSFPNAKVFLSDISEKALSIAKENASINKLDVVFSQGNLLEPLMPMKADLIVCNPPYISHYDFERLENSVKHFEPMQALVAEDGGLSFYKKMSEMLPQACFPKGRIAFEIGYNQKKALTEIFSKTPYTNLEFKKDLAGHDRFFFLEME